MVKGLFPGVGIEREKIRRRTYIHCWSSALLKFPDALKAQWGFQPEAAYGSESLPCRCQDGVWWGQNSGCPLLDRGTLEVADVPQFPSNKVPGESQPGRSPRDTCPH